MHARAKARTPSKNRAVWNADAVSYTHLAMTLQDFKHIQKYFAGEEKRDPSMTEIRVLDTYWSDHCRHTTFSTELKNVAFGDGFYREPMEKTYQSYLDARAEIFKDRPDKFVCLMDLDVYKRQVRLGKRH